MAPSMATPGRLHSTWRSEARCCVAAVQLQVVFLALSMSVLLLSGTTPGPETAPRCPPRDGWYRAAEMAVACAATLLAFSAGGRALAERLATPPARGTLANLSMHKLTMSVFLGMLVSGVARALRVTPDKLRAPSGMAVRSEEYQTPSATLTNTSVIKLKLTLSQTSEPLILAASALALGPDTTAPAGEEVRRVDDQRRKWRLNST